MNGAKRIASWPNSDVEQDEEEADEGDVSDEEDDEDETVTGDRDDEGELESFSDGLKSAAAVVGLR